ncbi:MAG: CRISPR-associated endonuclease Cas1 [Halothiobacillaceae bacterium]
MDIDGNPKSVQGSLPLPYRVTGSEPPLLPARMVNEYEYCPRLAYLEWVQVEWDGNADTTEGSWHHRRVDERKGRMPVSEELGDHEHLHARSVTLSSERLGLIARIDLIEVQDGRVVPVDYKRGKRPHVPKGAYAPERVQLCVQGLILEENGYRCDEGVLYFVGSRERVAVTFDDDLRDATARAVDGLRLVAAGGQVPPPLEDSPKCPRCSLVGICLPDEVQFLRNGEQSPRPLAVRRADALPLHVQANRAKICKRGENLIIESGDDPDHPETRSVRLVDVSQVVLMGNVYVTTPTLHELMRREIPVCWYSWGGWFLGHTQGMGHKNVEVRTAQYRASFDPAFCLRLAKALVRAKIHNARTFMRRNWRADDSPDEILKRLKEDRDRVARVGDLETLLGIEGTAARRYFSRFDALIRKPDEGETLRFDFDKRSRRPPTDPVNALLSFAYAVLARAWTVTLATVGLDPYRGFYHQPRYGRPALALDLMESFRPLIADSSVIQALNNGEVRPDDFIEVAGSVALKPAGRKRFLGVIERRMSQEVTHPLFGYRVEYRRLMELQARLLTRHLLGEIDHYPDFTTR